MSVYDDLESYCTPEPEPGYGRQKLPRWIIELRMYEARKELKRTVAKEKSDNERADAERLNRRLSHAA